MAVSGQNDHLFFLDVNGDRFGHLFIPYALNHFDIGFISFIFIS
jgi:hypothetical protein